MCAIIRRRYPSGKAKVTKNTISDTAITISLLIMGNWLTFSTSLRIRFPRWNIPIDANVPITVATIDDTVAISRVFPTADQSSGDLSEVKMDMYALKLKP